MKKILAILIAIVAITSCEKLAGGELEYGHYVGSVEGGTMHIHLLENERCTLQLSGGPEGTGSYIISGDNIKIYGTAYSTDDWGSRKFRAYYFMMGDTGKITSKTAFHVYYETSDDDESHCGFFYKYE